MTGSIFSPCFPVCYTFNHHILAIMKPCFKISLFNVTLCNSPVILRDNSFKGEVYITKYAT